MNERDEVVVIDGSDLDGKKCVVDSVLPDGRVVVYPKYKPGSFHIVGQADILSVREATP